MKKKVILGLSTIAVMSVFFASSSFAVKAAAPTCTKPRHKENYNISVYKKVMAHYSKDEIREYFAMRQVNDNTIIIADKGSIISVVGNATSEVIGLFICMKKVP